MTKVLSLQAFLRERSALRRQRKTLVFTNGTFDILHRGHVEYLSKARALGDALVVGLNTDASIRRIKGPQRPINTQADRACVLSALAAVDYVVLFGDDTPGRLIEKILPDILVKGADWKIGEIVGKDIVERNGGVVKTIRLTRGRSTTNVIHKVLRAYCSN
jgi:D-beta-D-heptose 7-phosphate kinase/D-beta-D-heptose 1-phosphate adenosyltransferase